MSITVTSQAIADVLAERQRQITEEGWTPKHDDTHRDMELAQAAACYTSHAVNGAWLCFSQPGVLEYLKSPPPFGRLVIGWPKSWSLNWWKPKNPRRDLVRAAALIIAEIERLDRLP